ncbi:MAG: hypothetical protein ACTSRU_16225 [Candidatus Hodarchaeales archaeon]
MENLERAIEERVKFLLKDMEENKYDYDVVLAFPVVSKERWDSFTKEKRWEYGMSFPKLLLTFCPEMENHDFSVSISWTHDFNSMYNLLILRTSDITGGWTIGPHRKLLEKFFAGEREVFGIERYPFGIPEDGSEAKLWFDAFSNYVSFQHEKRSDFRDQVMTITDQLEDMVNEM